MLGLPPLSPPKAKQTDTHLVVVSTSPDRPELDLPPVKTWEMKTENWLQFPAVSCSPTGAKHNIHGAGGILNRSQGSGARGSHNSAVRSSTRSRNFPGGSTPLPSGAVHALPGACASLGGLSALKVRPGLLCTWGAGAVPLGVQCLYLVRSRAWGGVQSECKGEEAQTPRGQRSGWQPSSLSALLTARFLWDPNIHSLTLPFKELSQTVMSRSALLKTDLCLKDAKGLVLAFFSKLHSL